MSEQDTFDQLKYKIVVDEQGSKFYIGPDDELHREDGPAIIWNDGEQNWYRNGQLHREDGPAIIDPEGYQAWYLHNKKLTEEEFNAAICS